MTCHKSIVCVHHHGIDCVELQFVNFQGNLELSRLKVCHKFAKTAFKLLISLPPISLYIAFKRYRQISAALYKVLQGRLVNSIQMPIGEAKGAAGHERKKLFLTIDHRICHRRMGFGLHSAQTGTASQEGSSARKDLLPNKISAPLGFG